MKDYFVWNEKWWVPYFLLVYVISKMVSKGEKTDKL